MQKTVLKQQKEGLIFNMNKLLKFAYNRNIITDKQYLARSIYVKRRCANCSVQFIRAYRNLLLVELRESRAITPSDLHVDYASSSALLFPAQASS